MNLIGLSRKCAENENRNCPNKDACWDYEASNCKGCAVGDLIQRQKKSIKRLKSELERYKRALRGACRIGAAIRTEEHIQARVDCFLRQADREIKEERK